MNRSFRASEPQRQGRSFGAVIKEKDEELALFLEMRKREKERNNLLFLHSSDDLDPPLGSKTSLSPMSKIVSSTPRKTATDDFLNADSDKNDYDWLLTPPGTPLFPSLEVESNKPTTVQIGTPKGQIGTPKGRPALLKSRLASPQMEPLSRGSLSFRQPAVSAGLNSFVGNRRPSSSGGPGSTSSRPATPTGRPTLSATSKPSRSSTPTSRATMPSKPASTSARVTNPHAARSSTPSARTSIPPSRSSTPSARSSIPASRSSTPSARPSIPGPKPPSRSATPTRRPSTPSSASGSLAPPGRSSSVTRSAPAAISRNCVPPRSSSPSVKPRPWQPSEMPGFSLDAPPNLRTSMPERSVSASRGRPGAPITRSSSVEAGSNGRVRRQSCSPSRGRAPNGSVHANGSSIPPVGRSTSNGSDSLSPVLIGTKMVERVINMRRLAPPKQDDQRSANGGLAGKTLSSPESTGFGRTLSKKSLDMALRHMDIRRSNSGSLRPLMTNIPASSMYSVRSGPVKSRTVSVSDSPIATSSNASSELSVNNVLCMDGSEMEDDDLGSERGGRTSPVSLHGR